MGRDALGGMRAGADLHWREGSRIRPPASRAASAAHRRYADNARETVVLGYSGRRFGVNGPGRELSVLAFAWFGVHGCPSAGWSDSPGGGKKRATARTDALRALVQRAPPDCRCAADRAGAGGRPPSTGCGGWAWFRGGRPTPLLIYLLQALDNAYPIVLMNRYGNGRKSGRGLY